MPALHHALGVIDTKVARRLELLDTLHVTIARIRNVIPVAWDVDLRKKYVGLAPLKILEGLEEAIQGQ